MGNSFEVAPSAGVRFVDVMGAWEFELYPGDAISEDWTDPLGNRHQRKVPAFADKRVRQALTHGIDIDSLIKDALPGLATRAAGTLAM